MPEESLDWPQTSIILLDHIRTLRQPVPSQTFPDYNTPEPRTSQTPNNTSPDRTALSRVPNGSSSSTQQPVSNPYTTATGQRIPRPPPYSALNTEDLARSPKERLKAFLAPSSESATKRTPDNSYPVTSNISTSPELLGQRNPSPVPKSSSESPHPVAAISERDDSKHAQASVNLSNPSLDSQMSSISFPTAADSESSKSKVASLSLTPAGDSLGQNDTGTTAASGSRPTDSAEDILGALTKEKQALLSRNEQLWKLVEKQRTMILGLNRDLEKVVRDREKYRKRLKEKDKDYTSLAASHPVSTASKLTESPHLLSDSSPCVSPAAQTREMVQKIQKDQDDSILYVPKPDSTDAEATIPNMMTIVGDPTADHTDPQSESPKLVLLSREDREVTDHTALVAASPSSENRGVGLSSSAESKRKRPPQPLNLSRTQLSRNPVAAEEAVESGSDYEDESPRVERGRRRTREDDDRLREATFLEEERRSRSEKESKTKNKSQGDRSLETEAKHVQAESRGSQQKPTDFRIGLASNIGLPASPRAPLPGGLQYHLQPSHESISSILKKSDEPATRLPGISQNKLQDVGMAPKSPGLPLKSPGLPMSPRPGDRPVIAPAIHSSNQHLPGSGPMSPRSAMILSPRAPRQPIPPPQSLPFNAAGPYTVHAEHNIRQQFQHPTSLERNQVRSGSDMYRGDVGSETVNVDEIHRGLVSEQYPEFLLPPNALPLVEVKVDSSRLRPSRNSYSITVKASEEDSIFTLAVHSRSDGKQLWRLEKALIALPILDQSLRRSPDFNAKLPDKSLFAGHAPAKIDLRRAALNQYFGSVLDTPLDESSALAVCDFLSTDVIGPRNRSSPLTVDLGLGRANANEKLRKEGYLAKKGKQLGGWKARYFILDGSELRYFEGPSGGHLGNIRLPKAQIAKQNADETSEDAEYRHAFMILEPKRKDLSSLTRHVLCAESDEERDGWVEALLTYVDSNEDDNGKTQKQKRLAFETPISGQGQDQPPASPSLHSVSYEQTVAANTPPRGSSRQSSSSPSPVDISSEFGTPSVLSPSDRPNISGPVAGGPIQNSQAWGNKSPTPKELDHRKRNIFGFRSRTSEDSAQSLQLPQQQKESRNSSLNSTLNSASAFASHNGRAVFGISLTEAADFFSPDGVDICLPAPVYRCIEYLEAKNAANEEGIFRMSGSNVVIKHIKERFNSEGDVKLLGGQNYDIHAVASVLKLYLRELPESVLTREHHLDFLKVLETESKPQRVRAINILAHRLPEANFEILATLSKFLINIVSNADVNKMNVRNVGIVFSPTLNIPAPLISLFLTDHEAIFGNAIAVSSPTSTVPGLDCPSVFPPSAAPPPESDDLRSPRKQMFTDLATPGSNQLSFPTQMHNDPLNHHQQQQPPQPATGAFDTSLDSIQPSYELSKLASANNPAQQAQYRAVPKPSQLGDVGGGGFGSLNAALASSGLAKVTRSAEQSES